MLNKTPDFYIFARMNHIIPKKEVHIFLLLIVASIVMRLFSFFPAVLNHDESTYLIIGRDLLQGKLLYVDVTDTKPPGIFWVYAFIHLLCGYSIFLNRLFVAIIVGLTSFFVYKSSVRLWSNKETAFSSAVIYLFYVSVWTNFGVSPNTELFFNLTTIVGLYLLLKHTKLNYALAGFIFGVGFIIKYLVLLDFVAIFAFYFIKELNSKSYKILKVGLVKYFYAGIGFLLPFVFINLYFYLSGHFDSFRFVIYELPLRYGQDKDLIKYILLILDFAGQFLPISFMFFYALFAKKKVIEKWQVQLFLVWVAAVMVAMYLPGKSFQHYSIQLMVPFSLVAGMYFHSGLKKGRFLNFVTGKKYGVYFLLAVFLITQGFGIAGKINKDDNPREVASYLKAHMQPEETVYLANYKHIVYFLLKTGCPTKYIHPSLLSNPQHNKAFGINGKEEIKKIIDSKPDWVVMYKHNNFVKSLMPGNYSIDTVFVKSNVEVYKIEP